MAVMFIQLKLFGVCKQLLVLHFLEFFITVCAPKYFFIVCKLNKISVSLCLRQLFVLPLTSFLIVTNVTCEDSGCIIPASQRSEFNTS